MGLWTVMKKIYSAESIRDTMRRSYDKKFELADKNGIAQTASRASGDSLHETIRYFALFGALEARYLVSGVTTNITEEMIWAELLPFLYLDKATGRRALAECVVYKEVPSDADIPWLETIVQKGCKLAKSKQSKYDALMPVAETNEMVWLLLLESRGNDHFCQEGTVGKDGCAAQEVG